MPYCNHSIADNGIRLWRCDCLRRAPELEFLPPRLAQRQQNHQANDAYGQNRGFIDAEAFLPAPEPAAIYDFDMDPVNQQRRGPELLDPTKDAARIRAMYTHPDYARRNLLD